MIADGVGSGLQAILSVMLQSLAVTETISVSGSLIYGKWIFMSMLGYWLSSDKGLLSHSSIFAQLTS